jgi:hypothetical protein
MVRQIRPEVAAAAAARRLSHDLTRPFCEPPERIYMFVSGLRVW